MADNFNYKQFLTENKLGPYSKLKEEQENNPKIDYIKNSLIELGEDPSEHIINNNELMTIEGSFTVEEIEDIFQTNNLLSVDKDEFKTWLKDNIATEEDI